MQYDYVVIGGGHNGLVARGEVDARRFFPAAVSRRTCRRIA